MSARVEHYITPKFSRMECTEADGFMHKSDFLKDSLAVGSGHHQGINSDG